MAEQPSTPPPPPTYVEKNPTEMPSAPEPPVAQPMTMHMPIQQPAGIPVASSSAQPVIIYTRDSGTSIYPNYNARYARAFGICQIIAGALAFVFQIAAIIVGSTFSFVAAGIWVGIMFIVAGSLAIGSAIQKSKCLVIATFVMSIISASLVLIIWSMSSIGIAMEVDNYSYDYYCFDPKVIISLLVLSCFCWSATGQFGFPFEQGTLQTCRIDRACDTCQTNIFGSVNGYTLTRNNIQRNAMSTNDFANTKDVCCPGCEPITSPAFIANNGKTTAACTTKCGRNQNTFIQNVPVPIPQPRPFIPNFGGLRGFGGGLPFIRFFDEEPEVDIAIEEFLLDDVTSADE